MRNVHITDAPNNFSIFYFQLFFVVPRWYYFFSSSFSTPVTSGLFLYLNYCHMQRRLKIKLKTNFFTLFFSWAFSVSWLGESKNCEFVCIKVRIYEIILFWELDYQPATKRTVETSRAHGKLWDYLLNRPAKIVQRSART